MMHDNAWPFISMVTVIITQIPYARVKDLCFTKPNKASLKCTTLFKCTTLSQGSHHYRNTI